MVSEERCVVCDFPLGAYKDMVFDNEVVLHYNCVKAIAQVVLQMLENPIGSPHMKASGDSILDAANTLLRTGRLNTS